jgi:hypothetical protein
MIFRSKEFSILKSSFIEYAAIKQISLHEAMRGFIASSREIEFTTSNDYSNYDNYSIDEFITMVHDSARQYTDRVMDDASKFAVRYGTELDTLININKLKEKSKNRGVNPNTNINWFADYLRRIPVVDYFGFDFNGGVRYSEGDEDCILLSKDIGSNLRVLISNIIVAFLFSKCELEDKNQVPFNIAIQRNENYPYDPQTIATSLYYVCLSITNPNIIRANEQTFEQIYRNYKLKNPFNIILSKQIYEGAYNFSLLHEFSHIIQSHDSKTKLISQEINADIMAQNINLWVDSKFNKIDPLIHLNKKLDNIFFIMKAIGPVVIIKTIELINSISGMKETGKHPTSHERLFFITNVNKKDIKHFENQNKIYNKIASEIECVFDYAALLFTNKKEIEPPDPKKILSELYERLDKGEFINMFTT